MVRRTRNLIGYPGGHQRVVERITLRGRGVDARFGADSFRALRECLGLAAPRPERHRLRIRAVLPACEAGVAP